MNCNTLSRPQAQTQHLTQQPTPSASRRNRVLDEAAKELNAHGVSLTSLAEIAAKLGISRAAMYYYVEDRQDLVFQCYRRACEVVGSHLDEAIQDGGSPQQVIARFVSGVLDPNEREIVASMEVGMMREAQREQVRNGYRPIIERIRDLLEAGEKDGLFRRCDAQICTRTILSMVSWTQLVQRRGQWVLPLSRERVASAMQDVLFNGLATKDLTELDYRPIDLTPVRIRVTTALDRGAGSDVKREALIGVASRLFNRKGIDSTSLEEIAAQVGATKRTLHRHLGSKQALVDACYERAFQVLGFIKDATLAYQGSRLSALRASLQASALIHLCEDMAVLTLHAGLNSLQSEGKQRLMDKSATLAAAYTDMVQRGIAEGSIRDGDVEGRVVALAGGFPWLVIDSGFSDPVKAEAVAAEIASLLTLGLVRR